MSAQPKSSRAPLAGVRRPCAFWMLFGLPSAAAYDTTRPSVGMGAGGTGAAALLPSSTLKLLTEVPPDLVKPPIRISPVFTLHLANGTSQGNLVVQLRHPCVQLGAQAVLGLAVESANEEFVRLAAGCSSESCACALGSPLRFEHGEGTLVRLMPDTFQLIPDGKLFARPDGVQHPQHDRAAAVVERARRWIALCVRTMSGGPDKHSLRLLLLALAALLLGGCVSLALLAALKLRKA